MHDARSADGNASEPRRGRARRRLCVGAETADRARSTVASLPVGNGATPRFLRIEFEAGATSYLTLPAVLVTARSPAGCGGTTDADPTARSVACLRSAVSHRSVVATASVHAQASASAGAPAATRTPQARRSRPRACSTATTARSSQSRYSAASSTANRATSRVDVDPALDAASHFVCEDGGDEEHDAAAQHPTGVPAPMATVRSRTSLTQAERTRRHRHECRRDRDLDGRRASVRGEIEPEPAVRQRAVRQQCQAQQRRSSLPRLGDRELRVHARSEPGARIGGGLWCGARSLPPLQSSAKRAGANSARSMHAVPPSTIRSAIARPVAVDMRMPCRPWPVAR